jgi:hypothetical protein
MARARTALHSGERVCRILAAAIRLPGMTFPPRKRPLVVAWLPLLLCALLSAAANAACAGAAFRLPPTLPRANSEAQETEQPLPVFEFHSGFWINLHHFLYKLAHDQNDSPTADLLAGAKLTPEEQRKWQGAVNYYAENYANLDPVVNSDLINLKNQLGDAENCTEISAHGGLRCDLNLPKELTRVLESAASVYRAHWWNEQDRSNRRWAAQVVPMVRQWGKELSEGLARAYQERWPAERIRVDVTGYANWAGAYTTLDPLRVTIGSLDPRNQGQAALEVLFHEASHGLAEPIQTAIARECRIRDKPIPRDLWHAVVFYTTAAVIQNVVDKGGRGAGALPKEPYTRRWSSYLQVIEKYWEPYLEGRADFGDAIARMVSSL